MNLRRDNPLALGDVVLIKRITGPKMLVLEVNKDYIKVGWFDRNHVFHIQELDESLLSVLKEDQLANQEPTMVTSNLEKVRSDVLVRRYVSEKRPILAIQRIRSMIGVGLKEAKDLYDELKMVVIA